MTTPASQSSPQLRLTVLLIIVGCLFVALVGRLWFLQVVQASSTRQQVLATGVEVVYTPAPRGEILDRDGRVLVDDEVVSVIEAPRQDATDPGVVSRLAALLGLTTKSLTTTLSSNQYTEFQPIPIYEHATPSQILYVQEHATEFPSVTATTMSIPHVTPLGEYAAAVLGYVGPISQSEWPAYKKLGYQATDQVGQSGVEQSYESVLRGKPGVTRIQVNSAGQPLSVLSSTAPVAGDNIRLTINAEIQKTAVLSMIQGQDVARTITDSVTHRKFTSPGGSVVVEDPKTGQIIALATVPTYNPNEFNNGGISQAQYSALIDNPADPLENRPIQGEYAPGSTFKVVTATAGLKYGFITPTSIYDDTGSITIGTQVFHDDGGVGAGPIALPMALTVSSDNYFNQIGIDFWDGRSQVGEDALQNVAASYGFNAPTGINLPDEVSGLIPSPQILQKEHDQYPTAYPYPEWYTGYSAEMAIGQFQVEVTPLQLANAYSAFANHGTLFQPQIALDAQTTQGHIVKRYAPVVKGHSDPLSPAGRAAMLAGFEGVTQNGNGTAALDYEDTNVARFDIAGKTGTAQVTGAGKQDTSVFTSFAPATDPQYVVDCFMEDSGYGATIAAPIVREVYQEIYHQPHDPVTLNEGTLSGNQL